MRKQEIRGNLLIDTSFLLLPLIFATSSCTASPPSSPVPPPSPPPKCAHGRPPNSFFPFPGLSVVTVFGDAKARSRIEKSYVEQAAKNWYDACQHKSHVPRFVVDWENDRPPFDNSEEQSQVIRTTVLIIFSPDEEAAYDTQIEAAPVAAWAPFDNSIKLFGKCGSRKEKHMPCKETQNTIIWESSWGSMAIAHEFGHTLGLEDVSPECPIRGLMKQVVDKNDTLSILPEYCRLVDDINNENCPCSSVETDSLRHPCDDGCDNKATDSF